jgi:hypothetical protein
MFDSAWIEIGAFVVPALLILCVSVLFWLRDPLPGSARRVSHAVWCPRYRRVAEVFFREAAGRTGLVRVVETCPLRRHRERCGEACALPPPRAAWRRRIERRMGVRPSLGY